MAAKRPRVVIVGAGMSGLAAAARLVEADTFDVVVLEALDRPGGRIHTSWQMGPALIELGANWIHGEDGNPLYKLAKENGLLKKQDPECNSSSSSSSSSSLSDLHENDSMKTRTRQNNEDIYILEDGTIAPTAIVNKVSMWCDNLKTASRDVSTHNGITHAGEYFWSGIERMIVNEVTDKMEQHVHRLIGKWYLRAETIDCACQSVHDLSLVHYNYYSDLPGDFYSCLGSKGYQGVLDVFLGKLPENTIRYCTPVDQVVWKQDWPTDDGNATDEKRPVVIHVKGCLDHVTADHVIITSSLGYLKENHLGLFKPALPLDKQEAIATLGFGTVDKIYLQFEEPFWNHLGKGDGIEGIQLLWEKDSWHDEPPVTMLTEDGKEEPEDLNSKIMRRFIGFDTVDGHDNVLCAWISGVEAECMELLPDDEIEKICTDILCKFLKREIPKPTQMVVSRWHSNPYIRGSYSAPLPVYGTGEEYDTMVRPVCQERQAADRNTTQFPLLLFAGEGCHKEFQSAAHGALATGQQQAERLIQFHQSRTK